MILAAPPPLVAEWLSMLPPVIVASESIIMSPPPRAAPVALVSNVLLVITTPARSADWSRFRGPNGSGISTDTKPIPSKWSEEKNLMWKAELPGPGSSCPIAVGNRIFLTCWSGYADGKEIGSLDKLQRHLVCINRTTGMLSRLGSYTAQRFPRSDGFANPILRPANVTP